MTRTPRANSRPRIPRPISPSTLNAAPHHLTAAGNALTNQNPRLHDEYVGVAIGFARAAEVARGELKS